MQAAELLLAPSDDEEPEPPDVDSVVVEEGIEETVEEAVEDECWEEDIEEEGEEEEWSEEGEEEGEEEDEEMDEEWWRGQEQEEIGLQELIKEDVEEVVNVRGEDLAERSEVNVGHEREEKREKAYGKTAVSKRTKGSEGEVKERPIQSVSRWTNVKGQVRWVGWNWDLVRGQQETCGQADTSTSGVISSNGDGNPSPSTSAILSELSSHLSLRFLGVHPFPTTPHPFVHPRLFAPSLFPCPPSSPLPFPLDTGWRGAARVALKSGSRTDGTCDKMDVMIAQQQMLAERSTAV